MLKYVEVILSPYEKQQSLQTKKLCQVQYIVGTFANMGYEHLPPRVGDLGPHLVDCMAKSR